MRQILPYFEKPLLTTSPIRSTAVRLVHQSASALANRSPILAGGLSCRDIASCTFLPLEAYCAHFISSNTQATLSYPQCSPTHLPAHTHLRCLPPPTPPVCLLLNGSRTGQAKPDAKGAPGDDTGLPSLRPASRPGATPMASSNPRRFLARKGNPAASQGVAPPH